MTNHITSALNGTKTEESLREALSNEALGFTKYTLFAEKAHNEGYEPIARMMREFAQNEKEHAELWLGYLDEMGDTEENLDAAGRSEEFEANTFYPQAALAAKDEGFTEMAEKFRLAGMVEKSHAAALRNMLDDMRDGDLYKGDAETEWVCLNCGYRTKGNMPPERCPLCSYRQTYFAKVED